MFEVYEDLYIGDINDCKNLIDDRVNWSVVHACKDPCHKNYVGYQGNLPPSHEHYLMFKDENDLVLNMIDARTPNFFSIEVVRSTMSFIESKLMFGKVLVHCNRGESRSASIVMLYMSKVLKVLPNDYELAKFKFRQTYPKYNPSAGIDAFMSLNWDCL
jgi:hypothetical protein